MMHPKGKVNPMEKKMERKKKEGSIQCMLIAQVASCNSDTTDLLVTRKGNESNHTEK